MPIEITAEQHSMMRYWKVLTPNIKPQALVENLVRRFGINKGDAWIIVTRLRNQDHTRETI